MKTESNITSCRERKRKRTEEKEHDEASCLRKSSPVSLLIIDEMTSIIALERCRMTSSSRSPTLMTKGRGKSAEQSNRRSLAHFI